ncbi:MAG TPA: glutathione S-transferase family protein [Caulobacteraceae bacterium]|jgi:glutathione S-transferase|nr:glutathione S-transferase family protein [Caulobacteraceae bacterium]
MELIIGDKNKSSWSLRPWLVLKRSGRPFTETVIRLDVESTAAEILKHSPTAKVPALRTDEGHVVWDSMAICVHIAEKEPGKFWPADQAARDYARSASCEMHSGFPSLRGECPMNLALRTTLDLSEATAKDVRRLVALFTEGRRRFGASGPYLCGTWSVADAFFTPVATRFRSYGIALSDHGDTGEAGAYCATLLNDPDFQDWERAAVAEVGQAA